MSSFFQKIVDSLKNSWEGVKEINILENFKDIFSQPLGILTVVALLIIMFVMVRARKIKFTPRLLAQISIMLALTIILDTFKIYRLPQGGSVTLGSMLPIFLISLWYGPEIGMLTGFIFGIISLILGPYVIHPVQLLLDYPLPYLALGIAGYFRKNKYLGVTIGIILRFICHIVSGVVFFAEYAAESGYSSALLYSIVYNGSFLIIDSAICIVLLALIPFEKLTKVANSSYHVTSNK
ncbi:MAG: energy-coupled thiamine transporter ThiT [Clostridiales bacterium]|uniref:energy-coupled thiamine transporter ThiT n=1 Tax=Clostridium sp. N3C TaxID=1776758 RepID=UPI00092DF590|nr:energy-coupled thiamine transporter ThiT [Clostridium sp. N3C]NLZ48310.1 energy-coupled thiamine transporter ThiT [Clostridiales bacterium]SCN22986.1 Thiamine ECF transporter S component ThiT [Clostridium sp. N3C]